MSLPAPFAYPTRPHQRRHGPAGYETYASYKPWLRDEFAFRCVYCLEREQWYPNRADAFSVDHVIPQALDPSQVCDYANLVYACHRCNSMRQDARLLNPTSVALSQHLRLAEEGLLEGLSQEGWNLIELLHLNSYPALEVRRNMLEVLRLKAELPENPKVDRLFLAAFGYPSDLPNLASLRPPGGNTRPEGVLSSYFGQAAARTLPEWY